MLTHKKPQGYIGFAPSDEWNAEAKKLQLELENTIHGMNITVSPAIKGSWKSGYTWRGRFKIEVTPRLFGNTHPPVHGITTTAKRYFQAKNTVEYIEGSPVYSRFDILKPAWKWLKHLEDKWSPVRQAAYLVAIYRQSGLIPHSVAVRHGRRVRLLFGETDKHGRVYINYAREDVRAALRLLSTNYLRLHAKCPTCAGKGFQETILGYACNHCSYEVHDHGGQFEK